jgi:serine/threonine-protein kinase
LAAEESRHDEAAALALISMSHLAVDRLYQMDGPRDWTQLAGAILRRIGSGQATLEAWRLTNLGGLASRQGHAEQALKYYQQSLALQREHLGIEHVDVAKSLNNLGVALYDMNRFEESLASYRQSRAMATKLLGPLHPDVAQTLVNEGEVLNALGRYEEARATIERALEIGAKAASSSYDKAYALTNLGQSFLGLGREHDARAPLEEALRLFESIPAAPLAATRFTLARALWPNSRDRPRALLLAEEAKVEYTSKSDTAPRAVEVEAWLRTRRRH